MSIPAITFRGLLPTLQSLATTGYPGVLFWTNDSSELYVDLGSGNPGTGQGSAWQKLTKTNTVFIASSLSAMVALVAQVGDFCNRTDTSQTFLLTASPATSATNWKAVTTASSLSTFLSVGLAGPVANTWDTYVDSLGVQRPLFVPPLLDREMYFSADTGQLYVGYQGINFKIGAPAMSTVTLQGNANPTQFLEPQADGSSLSKLWDGTNVLGTPTHPLKIDGSGVTQPVSGTFFQATQPVSLAALPALSAGAALIGQVEISDGTNVLGTSVHPVKVDGSGVTQPVSGTVTANVGTTNGLALDATQTSGSQKTQLVNGSGVVADVNVKGTQGANAVAVQELKDAGRVIKIFQAALTPATTEAILTLTPVSDGTAGTAASSFAVTAGKRLRIQALLLSITNTTAAVRGTQVVLRMSASGAVTVASPPIAAVAANTPAATAQIAASQAQSFPDGVELSGTMQLGVSAVGTALAGSTVTVVAYEY